MPNHESSYIRRDKGAILSDTAAFYTAFGVAVDPDSHHRTDHLCAQLEFVALLLVKLARAKSENNAEAVWVTEDALGKFNRDHVMEWLPSFISRLASCAPHPFYMSAADLLWSVWERLWEQPKTAAFEDVRTPETDPGTPYECDMV
ncbi:MAG: molecular chaperone TorD family protein [Myxococcales bacterium]|nr:molecular chaperone TorD family protein [Myxococcales bacterium]